MAKSIKNKSPQLDLFAKPKLPIPVTPVAPVVTPQKEIQAEPTIQTAVPQKKEVAVLFEVEEAFSPKFHKVKTKDIEQYRYTGISKIGTFEECALAKGHPVDGLPISTLHPDYKVSEDIIKSGYKPNKIK